MVLGAMSHVANFAKNVLQRQGRNKGQKFLGRNKNIWPKYRPLSGNKYF